MIFLILLLIITYIKFGLFVFNTNYYLTFSIFSIKFINWNLKNSYSKQYHVIKIMSIIVILYLVYSNGKLDYISIASILPLSTYKI